MTKDNIPRLALIIGDASVVHSSGKQFDYDFIVSQLNKLVDDIDTESNNELTFTSLYDTRGDNGNYNAGILSFGRTDGFADTFFTSSEATMNRLKQLYGVK